MVEARVCGRHRTALNDDEINPSGNRRSMVALDGLFCPSTPVGMVGDARVRRRRSVVSAVRYCVERDTDCLAAAPGGTNVGIVSSNRRSLSVPILNLLGVQNRRRTRLSFFVCNR